MRDFSKLTVIELREGIVSREFSSVEVVEFFIKKCEEKKNLNAVVEIFYDAREKAKEIDKKIAAKQKVGKLAGVPIAIKDNVLYKGKKMGCASKILQGFVAPYTATIVEKMIAEDAIILGRTNMDEFAMGSSCENSVYGPCHNAFDFDYVSGGSSGGSAVAVAAGMVPCAIGSDTGGSIRQPASFNGVVGVKPTYGTVSRYGIVAFASSLDQAAPITKTVEDCQLLLEIISGKDLLDVTTIENDFGKTKKTKYKLGICKQIMDEFKKMPGYQKFEETIQKIKGFFDFVEVEIPHIAKSLACYCIISRMEAASNMSRFDGIKFAQRSESAKDLESVYVQSRSEGLGKEVKRRIMLGNFILSSDSFDVYYKKSRDVQKLIKKEFNDAFKHCDCIILPTTTGTSFKIGEKLDDPIAMYLEDLFTVPSNIAGIPAVTVPYAKAENGLPLGMQFFADNKCEKMMFDVAKQFQNVLQGGLL